MKVNKLGLVGLAAAGAVAITVAHGAATSGQAIAAAAATAPKATPAKAPAPKPATPAKAPAPVDPHAGHAHAAPATAAAMPSGPAGTAEVKELVFDAGNVERGVDIKHDFQIKNVGKHDLTVDAKPG